MKTNQIDTVHSTHEAFSIEAHEFSRETDQQLREEAYRQRRGALPWWIFQRELRGVKIPFVNRWLFLAAEGTGCPLALGLGFGFRLRWGTAVLTLPFLELVVGYGEC